MTTNKSRNSIKQERALAKSLGFDLGLAKNPIMTLADGSALVWLAGQLIAVVTTSTFFNTGQHLKAWKPSNKNELRSRMSSTQRVYIDGRLTKETQIYYRQAKMHEIKSIAKALGKKESDIKIDHINRKAGDNRDENTEPASARQNNLNRGKPILPFYTVEELKDNISKGIWVPVSIKTER